MQTTQFNRQKGILALVLLSLVFASMGLFVRYLNTEFTLLQQVYLRVLAAFILGLFIFRKDIHKPPPAPLLEPLRFVKYESGGLCDFQKSKSL